MHAKLLLSACSALLAMVAVYEVVAWPGPCGEQGAYCSLNLECKPTTTLCAVVPPCSVVGQICNYCSGADSGLQHMACATYHVTSCCFWADCDGSGGCGRVQTASCYNVGTPEVPVYECRPTGTTSTGCLRDYCQQQ